MSPSQPLWDLDILSSYANSASCESAPWFMKLHVTVWSSAFTEELQYQSRLYTINISLSTMFNLWQHKVAADHSWWISEYAWKFPGESFEFNSRTKVEALTFSDIWRIAKWFGAVTLLVHPFKGLYVNITPAGGRSALLWLKQASCVKGWAWLASQALSHPNLVPLHCQKEREAFSQSRQR